MDAAVAACQDFNLYGNGGWLKTNPIPADQSYWGSFTILEETNRESLHKVLEKVSKASNAPGSDDQKVGDFYFTCMDEAAVEAQGLAPLQGELAAIEKIGTVADLQAEIARLQMLGVNAVFQFGSDQDRRNASEVIVGAYQGGLGLPDRDYYTKIDDESKKLRDEYLAHVTKMFTLMGDAPEKAAENAKTVMALETRLAEASMTRVERRDPDKTYNRKSLAEIALLTPNFSWTAYMKEIGAPPVAAVNVGQPKYFEAVEPGAPRDPSAAGGGRTSAGTSSTPRPPTSRRSSWTRVKETSTGKTLRALGKRGAVEALCLLDRRGNRPRPRRGVRARILPPEAKARATLWVKNLIAALRADLTPSLDGRGDAQGCARPVASRRLRPRDRVSRKWRDYSALKIDTRALRSESPARQRVRIPARPLQGRQARRPDRVGNVAADRNTYYNPQKATQIVFPAGILQPRSSTRKADDAVNYSAMGAVIGHEMTHGFDDQGREFDAQGNLREWWTPEDLKNYEERSECVEQQYDSYVYDSQRVNGKLVLGEATADLGVWAHRLPRLSLDARRARPSRHPSTG